MSGGHFDYAFAHVSQFAEELERFIARQGQPSGWDDETYQTFSEEVNAELQRILADTRRLAFEMREVEWLASGDTDGDEFLRRIKEG